MYITSGNTQVPASKLVKDIGKYLYKNLDGAYDIKQMPNECSVYSLVYYQLPEYMQVPWNDEDINDVQEMDIVLNLATYQNKVRLNIIVLDEDERNLAFYVFGPEKLQNKETAKKLILKRTFNVLNKEFEGYEFIY